MRFVNKIIIFSNVSLMLVFSFLPIVNAEDKNWDSYPKHIHHCLEAMNYHMGDEKKLTIMMSVQDVGDSDCRIYASFKTEEQIEQFNSVRAKNGFDPNYVMYKDHKIFIHKELGEEQLPH